MRTQLARVPYPYPTLHIKRRPASIFGDQYENFEVLDDQHHPAIRGSAAVPQDLLFAKTFRMDDKHPGVGLGAWGPGGVVRGPFSASSPSSRPKHIGPRRAAIHAGG